MCSLFSATKDVSVVTSLISPGGNGRPDIQFSLRNFQTNRCLTCLQVITLPAILKGSLIGSAERLIHRLIALRFSCSILTGVWRFPVLKVALFPPQFHDKIDPMLESLNRIAERLRQPPSISVEVEKIREQISENKAVNVDLEKLQPSYETLKQRGEDMITRSEGADKDLSAKGKHLF